MSRSSLHLFEFLKTSRNARKNIQYSMAANTRIIAHSTAPKIHRNIKRKTVNKSQSSIPIIIPPIPSPTAISAGNSNPDVETSGIFPVLILSVILPMSSFSLIPLYSPMVRKRKKAMERTVVERMEFSKIVLCWPSPKSQMLIVVNAATTMVTIKIVRVVTSRCFALLRKVGLFTMV